MDVNNTTLLEDEDWTDLVGDDLLVENDTDDALCASGLDTDRAVVVMQTNIFQSFKQALTQRFGNVCLKFFEENDEYMSCMEAKVVSTGFNRSVRNEIICRIDQYIKSSLSDHSDSFLAGSVINTETATCGDRHIEDAMLEDGYESDDSVELSDKWTLCSPEWIEAKRELKTAVDTFERTRTMMETEKHQYRVSYENQLAVVKQKKACYKRLKAMELSGISVGVNHRIVKEDLLSTITQLKSIVTENRLFCKRAQALEAALSANVAEKTQKFQALNSLEEVWATCTSKTEVQQLRRIAYEKNRTVRRLKMVALSTTDHAEAMRVWDEVIAEAHVTRAAWEEVVRAIENGLKGVPEEDRGWWLRASDSVKHSLYGEVVAVHWYMAMKSECNSKLCEARLSRSTEESLYYYLRVTLMAVSETVQAWHNVCTTLRNCLDDVIEIFESWWIDKLNSSIQAEAFWCDLQSSIENDIKSQFPVEAKEITSQCDVRVTDNCSSFGGSSSSFATALASSYNCSSVSMSAVRESSAVVLRSLTATTGSLHTVDFDDWLESEPRLRKLPVGREVTDDRKPHVIADLMTQASAERSRIRSVHSALMSDDMNSRQELLVRSCFQEADVARAELLQIYQTQQRVNISILSKLAHVVSLDNAAARQYADMVRCEAIEDSHMDEIEARTRREDWQRRIAVDAMVVLETRALRNRAALGDDVVEKVRTRRNHLRAKAVLAADEKAFNAAWGTPK